MNEYTDRQQTLIAKRASSHALRTETIAARGVDTGGICFSFAALSGIFCFAATGRHVQSSSNLEMSDFFILFIYFPVNLNLWNSS